MVRIKERIITLLTGVLLLLSSIPTVTAYRSGFAPLDMPVEMISKLFNIPALGNEIVQIGFIKFGLWVLLFTLFFWAFGKLRGRTTGEMFDRKTAGILAAVISLIGVIFMPAEWVLAQGGLMVAVSTSLIVLGLVAGGVYGVYAFAQSENFLLRLVGVAVAFLLLSIIVILQQATNLENVEGILSILIALPLQVLLRKQERGKRR